ncbi:MAG: ABC transporter permease [Spirochaetales bacterium]|nr:ABC transporter permease [Spirochaetales bacterium]
MQTARLAFRNLSRQKRRSFLLGGAIAFGVMIVTLIDGFAGAFVDNVSENFSNLLAGHVFVEGVEKSPKGRDLDIIRDDAALREAAEAAGIEAKYVSRRSALQGSLKFAGRTASLAVQGVDFAAESFLAERLALASGSLDNLPRDGIVIPEPIADKLGVETGDRLLVTTRTYSGQQNVGEFAVAAVIKDPGILGSISAYATRDYVNELLDLAPDEYQALSFYLPSLSGMDEAGDRLHAEVSSRLQTFEREAPGAEGENPILAMMRGEDEETWTGVKYRVTTLNDALAQVQQIVDVLETASLVILLVLFLIIMVGITNTFRIIMYERIREIGTMRAVGMQRGQVRGLFLWEALFLALGGAVAGLAAASLVMLGVGLIDFGLDSPLFIILKNGHMSFRLDWASVALKVAIVAFLTLAAAFLPARSAAKLDPAVALRTAV